MDIDQLRTFLSVLEHGGFSRAAEALGIGQSTVSFHIKALEESVAVRLLDRAGGRLAPTAAGKILRRYAQRMMTLRDEALAALREDESGSAGLVRVAASTIPGEYLLPRILGEFRREYPGVTVTMAISDSARAVEKLLAGECDLAVAGARSADKRIVHTPFAHDEVALVAPVPNPFFKGYRLVAKQLAGVPLVVRESGSGTRGAIERVLAAAAGAGGPVPDSVGPASRIEVGSTEAVRRCLLEGAGVGFISSLAIADDLKAKRLRVVALTGTPVKRTFYVLRLRSITPSGAARAFLATLAQQNRS